MSESENNKLSSSFFISYMNMVPLYPNLVSVEIMDQYYHKKPKKKKK